MDASDFRIHAVAAVDLTVTETPVPWQIDEKTKIDRHWDELCRENPTLWDGRTHLVTGGDVVDGTYRATCHAARFAALLHWRDLGYPALGFRTTFGAALPITADGAVLLGRMSAHTANAGKVYAPGGAFDGLDVVEGRVDAAAAIARECEEELGLAAPELSWDPGFVICENDVRIAVNRIARVPIPADEARARIMGDLARQEMPELADVRVVRSPADAIAEGVEPYALALVTWLADRAMIGPNRVPG